MFYCNDKSIFAKYLLPRSIKLNGIHKTKTLSFIIKKIIYIYILEATNGTCIERVLDCTLKFL